MSRRVVISGLGPVTGLGIGMQSNWERCLAGESALAPITAFDPAGFDCRIAAQVEPYKISDYVPKSYRKATKVMARDIELAVIAADCAARDASLLTPATDPEAAKSGSLQPTYAPQRVGCHIGAGLIAADINELTEALVQARDDSGAFDIHKWGDTGMGHLTPLWLLKYLPNMLACHVTILHDARGPSNTITCGESAGTLSLGESLRVIQRGAADCCFCGGAESKLNPMAYLRQQMAGRLTAAGNDDPTHAVRPFDMNAAGTAMGEGGCILVLEAMETFEKRVRQPLAPGSAGGAPAEPGANGQAYCEVVGFCATQTINPAKRNLEPNEDGRSIVAAIWGALREAKLEPDAIDVIAPFACGVPMWDRAEAAALRQVFGQRSAMIPTLSVKASVGNCGAGSGAVDVAFAARVLHSGKLPKVINRAAPLPGIGNGNLTTDRLNCALVVSVGFGGQNAAVVLKRLN
ncbi:MAG: hypothetical protein IT445_07330 [Phycisphaeraceae bacterium]|nr:hypothetical protein [Phycisphaeraceae bacterium]